MVHDNDGRLRIAVPCTALFFPGGATLLTEHEPMLPENWPCTEPGQIPSGSGHTPEPAADRVD